MASSGDHLVNPGEVETFHDQVGCWLWEPAARTADSNRQGE